MTFLDVLHNLLFDYTLRTVALGSAILGVVSGALGAFAVLRRQSLLGDSVSHTALPGIALAFLLTGAKTPLVLIIGAAVAGWGGTLLVLAIVNHTRIKSDGALGLVLSIFFGFGLVLLTMIQKMPDSRQAGLETFLFGQATALLQRDVLVMGVIGGAVILILLMFWKEFKLASFDADFGVSLGFPIRYLDILLTSILVIAIVIGLQTVGVVLMSAMVVAPAAAARQWTNKLGLMVLLAAFFGAIAGVIGAVISSLTARLPTGPTIVLCVSGLVIISVLAAPNRGVLWSLVRRRSSRRRLAIDSVLLDLYELALQHENTERAHPVETLQAMSRLAGGSVVKTLEALRERGWARQVDDGQWTLTDLGVSEARRRSRSLEASR